MTIKKAVLKGIGAIISIFIGYSFYYAAAESLPYFEGFMASFVLIMILLAVNRVEEEETEEETEE